MKKVFLYITLLLLPALILTACEDNTADENSNEYDNWQSRNSTFFTDTLAAAKLGVAQAKEQYGEEWAAHTPWRLYPSYAKAEPTSATDTICVRIVENGAGSGYPYYTDSVKVNFIAKLIPTVQHPEGLIFAYSGLYNTEEAVFSPSLCVPSGLAVSNTIEGLSTALQRMRIGDRWRVFIPQQLAYGSSTITSIPAYSTLIYDVQLKSFYRAGESASN